MSSNLTPAWGRDIEGIVVRSSLAMPLSTRVAWLVAAVGMLLGLLASAVAVVDALRGGAW